MTTEKKAVDATETKTVEKAAKPERVVQNGVTRPLEGTLCGKAWAIADQMSKTKGSPVAVSDLLIETNKVGLNEANVRAEYARWRKFYNITGTILSEATIAKRKAREEEKARKEAEKEAKRKAREEEKAKREEEKARKAAEREAAKEAKEAERKAKAEAKAKAKAEEAAKKAAQAEEKAKTEAAKAAKKEAE